MNAQLAACLDDLTRRIDEDAEEQNLAEWSAFLDNQCRQNIFTPTPRTPAPAGLDWPTISVNQAIADIDAMVLSEFRRCSDQLAGGGTQRLAVRCNYGTGILSSLFGCETFMMDDALNTLPTSRPLGSRDRVAALLDAGVPDLNGALGGEVFRAAERFGEVLEDYPVLGRHVSLYHPDTQGPIDLVEVIWGSGMFLAFYDDTDLLRNLLTLITDTYIAFLHKWFKLASPSGKHAVHWGLMHGGAVMLRNDSLMNLSPEMYADFVRPMDQRIFDEFGGGAIHFCGRGDHYIPHMSEMTGLTAIHMSQSELNDMETIFRHTVDKGIKLLALRRDVAEQAGRPLNGQVHCR